MKVISLNQQTSETAASSSGIHSRRLSGAALRTLLLSCLILISLPSAAGAQQRRGRRPPPTPVGPQAPAPQNQAVPQKSFDQLATEAGAAREADRVDEAVALYRQGVTLQPQWAEGWWYLATLYYDQNNYPEA